MDTENEPSDFELLGTILRSTRWSFEAQKRTQNYRMAIDTEDGQEEIFASILRYTDTFTVICVMPFVAGVQRRAAAADLVARVNWGLRMGCFEIQMESGAIRYRHCLDFRGTALSRELVNNMVRGCLQTIGQYFPAFRSFVKDGLSPEEALAVAECD